MDPTQNQSGTPGPIFSAGPGPEEPPMTGAPSSGPRNPFSSGGGDIILQPSNDYYSGNQTARSKKSIIIIGIIAVVAVVTLLVVLSVFSRSGTESAKINNNLYQNASAIYNGYSHTISLYDEIIGLDPSKGGITQHPENILFDYADTYYTVYEKSDSVLELLQKIENTAKESKKYEEDINFIVENAKTALEAIKENTEIVENLNEAFILPIQNSENWQFPGCVSNFKTQGLLNNQDKNLASIAQGYNQLACKDDIQIVFGYGDLKIPESVDESTMEILRTIAKSLVNYLGKIDVGSKDEVLNRLQTIMDATKPETPKEETDNQNESEENK